MSENDLELGSAATQTQKPENALSSVLLGAMRVITPAIEFLSVLALVTEVILLSMGLLSRYVIHRPIIWVDEVAATVFVWLIMIGSAVALHRGEHMRLTALVTKLGPAQRAWVDILGRVMVMGFLVVVLFAGYQRYLEEAHYPMSSTGLPSALRTLAIPVGIVLMLIVASAQLSSRTTGRQFGIAVAVIAAITVAFLLAKPLIAPLGNINLLIFFVVFLGILIAAGMQIAMSFGIVTVGYLSLVTYVPLSVIPGRIDEGASHPILLSIPLFVILGGLLELTGMASALIRFLSALLGHVRGGLSYVLIAAMYLVSGISGSKAADMAAVGPPLIPEMERRGYKRGEMVALLAGSGVMAETIPPSIALIMIGSITGVSIGALFAAGFLPALIMAVPLAILAYVRSANTTDVGGTRAPTREILKTFVLATPVLSLPLVIRFAVVEGIATTTEVAVVGIAYSILVGLIVYRTFNWRRLYPMLVNAASLTGAILFIVGVASSMGWALTQSGFAQQLSSWAAMLPGGAIAFLALTILLCIILGSVLEGIPALILLAPLMFPVAHSLGIHEVQYAMVSILSMGIGAFAPPLGVGFYTACAITRCDPDEAFWPHWPYVAALLVGLLVVSLVPAVSLVFVK